jgi:membrane protease YdiL (CAAX protease family)
MPIPAPTRALQRLQWPLRGAHGGFAAGWLAAADVVVWGVWFTVLLLFLEMPPWLGMAWVLVIGGAFVWRYCWGSALAGARRKIHRSAGFGSAPAAAVAVAALALAVFGQFWDVVYRRLPGIEGPPASPWTEYSSTSLGFAVTAIVMVAIGPIMEEFCFRGWILPVLADRYGIGAGVLASSLLFAAIHAWASWIPYFFVAGVLLALAVRITGSVWTGVALHSGYNIMCLALEPVFPTPESIASWTDSLGAGRWSAPLGMMAMLAVLAWQATRVTSDGARHPR